MNKTSAAFIILLVGAFILPPRVVSAQSAETTTIATTAAIDDDQPNSRNGANARQIPPYSDEFGDVTSANGVARNPKTPSKVPGTVSTRPGRTRSGTSGATTSIQSRPQGDDGASGAPSMTGGGQ